MIDPAAMSAVTYARLVERCELGDDFWTCMCETWPIWREVGPYFRGNESKVLKFLCLCGSGVSHSDVVALSETTRMSEDQAVRVEELARCGGLERICCLLPHVERLVMLERRFNVTEIDEIMIYLCACMAERATPPRGPEPTPAEPPDPAPPSAPTPVAVSCDVDSPEDFQ